MRFEWDPEKDRANEAKHGLSFSQASDLFVGETDYLEIFDEEHSVEEDRFIAIGGIDKGLIVVVWTEREDGLVRIISARMATKEEQRRYRRFMDRKQ